MREQSQSAPGKSKVDTNAAGSNHRHRHRHRRRKQDCGLNIERNCLLSEPRHTSATTENTGCRLRESVILKGRRRRALPRRDETTRRFPRQGCEAYVPAGVYDRTGPAVAYMVERGRTSRAFHDGRPRLRAIWTFRETKRGPAGSLCRFETTL